MSEGNESRFAPPAEPEVALDLSVGFVPTGSRRMSVTAEKAYAESAHMHRDKRVQGQKPASFAERKKKDRQLYWVITRIPVLMILGWFTLSHIALGSEWVFIDGVNLLFHEAGHVLFGGWGGDTLMVLGGSLLQIVLPAIFVLYFSAYRGERFAATTCLWWVGENLLNIARYMHDAPVEELPLVGGDTHDWKYLFEKWEMLSHARTIADFVRTAGIIVMMATLVYLLYMVFRPTTRELIEGR